MSGGAPNYAAGMQSLALPSLLLLGSCAFLRSPTVPMPAVHHPAPAEEPRGLVVLLPGLGDGPDYYLRHGFIDRIRELDPHLDVVAADAHFGYYRTRSVVERLHTDLIAPAIDRYDEVWLVGISMGGFGATLYAMQHSDVVDGIVLLAPYLGSRDVIAQIEAAGGLAAWHAPDATAIDDDETRTYYELWSWYRGYAGGAGSRPELWLGCGDEDRLRAASALIADVLPEHATLTRPGGHKWKVWKPMFAELAQRAFGRGQPD